MMVKLLCLLWGHRTVVRAETAPSVIYDSSLFKAEVPRYVGAPNSQHDINLALLPPHMSVASAFYFGPTQLAFQNLPFCVRCGQDVNSTHNVTELAKAQS